MKNIENKIKIGVIYFYAICVAYVFTMAFYTGLKNKNSQNNNHTKKFDYICIIK